jgi:Universal stress protein family
MCNSTKCDVHEQVNHEFHCLFEDGSRFEAGVGDRICEIADDKQAAAVIVSAHRKSMLSEFMLGSTSNFLVHSCARPVVVLYGPRREVRTATLSAVNVPCIHCRATQQLWYCAGQ